MYVMLWRALMPEIMPGRWRSGVMPCVMAGRMPLVTATCRPCWQMKWRDAAQSAMLAATGFDADPLLQTLELTDGLDMPDQSRARLHKAMALS